MDLKKLIEEINALSEDELKDDFSDVEISDEELVEEPEVDVTKKLESKTKISRALDVLKGQIEDFKDAVIGDIDLVNDTVITSAFETLDDLVNQMQNSLNGEEAEDVTDEEVNIDITEEPVEEVEEVETEEEPAEEVDFDSEASLDIFNVEEQ